MSMEMIDIAKKLLASSIDGKTFSEEFFKTWRSERDSGVLAQDDASLGRCLSLMFGLADSFTEGKKERPGELTEGCLLYTSRPAAAPDSRTAPVVPSRAAGDDG